jgi:hypothetical protein
MAAVGLRAWSVDDASSPVCFVKQCTGASCPGCGLTRSFGHLVRGDLVSSWRLHPLAIVFLIESVAVWIVLEMTRNGRMTFDWNRHGTWWLAAHIPLLIGVWAVRMLTGTLPV